MNKQTKESALSLGGHYCIINVLAFVSCFVYNTDVQIFTYLNLDQPAT